MTALDVYLEGEGLAGRLASDDTFSLSYQYSEGYAGPPLSLRLPVRPLPYGDSEARAFFGNLLQEGWRLERIAARHRVARTDIAGLLVHLGRECPGAISVVPENQPPGKAPGILATDYREISAEQLREDVAALYARRAPRAGTEFSLAGVQSKMAVTLLADGRVAEPIDGAPTTHILKVGNAEDELLVENEFVCLRTAALLGLPVVPCGIGRAGQTPYLLVPRFDRRIDNGLVRRLHQEDCCQALGLATSMKYEKDRDPDEPTRAASFANLFALARRTADPLSSLDSLIRVAFYNYLIGNADAHAKNFALLLPRGRRPRLAPFYDLVCIALYDSSQEFAMRFGGRKMWDQFDRDSLERFLADAGIKGKGVDRIAERLLRPMAATILDRMQSVIESSDLGLSRVRLVRHCVGERIRHLNESLGWRIPVTTDAMLRQGGGWRMGS